MDVDLESLAILAGVISRLQEGKGRLYELGTVWITAASNAKLTTATSGPQNRVIHAQKLTETRRTLELLLHSLDRELKPELKPPQRRDHTAMLPTEILSDIFELAGAQQPGKVALRLTRVSPRFRAIALHCQNLWSHISNMQHRDQYKAYLTRSKQAGLSVAIYGTGTTHSKTDDNIFLSLIISHASRWKTLVVDLLRSSKADGVFLKKFMSSLSNLSIPSLETLSVEVPYSLAENPMKDICGSLDMPNLRHLRLLSCNFSRLGPRFKATGKSLRKFDVNTVYFAEGWAPSFLSFLGGATSLEVLTISLSIIPEEWKKPFSDNDHEDLNLVKTLQNLKELNFRFSGNNFADNEPLQFGHFTRSMQTPALRKLVVEFESCLNNHDDGKDAWLTASLPSGCHDLRELHILAKRCRCEDYHIWKSFESDPRLAKVEHFKLRTNCSKFESIDTLALRKTMPDLLSVDFTTDIAWNYWRLGQLACNLRGASHKRCTGLPTTSICLSRFLQTDVGGDPYVRGYPGIEFR